MHAFKNIHVIFTVGLLHYTNIQITNRKITDVLFCFQIYDVTTGQKIMSLQDHDLANNYTRNRATFNPTDDLILNDGVLWDVNSGKPVHKFDKFNENVSGVFHPMGLEVIINSEVVSFEKSYL